MANLTYRQAIQQAPADTTTKNASLTSQEIDGNFKSLNDELIAKAPLVSPGFSGVPTAPTAALNTNTTQIASTAFVIGQAGTASPSMDGVSSVGTSTKFAREDHVHPTDTTRAPLASPALTGTPTAPTAALNTNTTQLATTAFVIGQAGTASPSMDGVGAVGNATKFAREDHVHPTDTTRAPLASPALTGIPTAPTAALNTNTTQLATTAFVIGQAGTASPSMDGVSSVGTSTKFAREDHVHPTDTTRAPLASPALTGIPTAPTAALNTNTTQIASTAFVIGQAGTASPLQVGVSAVGTSTKFAREDHSHPTNATSTNTGSTIVQRDASGNFSAGTITAALSGNAATATTATTATQLATARTINGTNFDGSANITTSSWGTSRTITVGNTGKAVSGSANVSWSLAEIGADDASNLVKGTVPDARLSGTYSGFTHKIGGPNTVFTTPSTGTTSPLGRTVYGLAEYKSNNSSQVGAIVFIAPNTASSIMHLIEVSALLHNQSIVVQQVQGHRDFGAWNSTRKVSTGSADIQTRWGVTPDGRNCLILGDVATVWAYPHISITKAMFSYNGVTDSYCTGWTVAVVTDLSAYTNVTATITDSPMTGSVTGNASTATTLQTGRAINGVTFNGSAPIDIQWKAVAIPVGADLDTYQSEGVYFVATNATAATLVNSPTTNAFTMRVWKAAGVVQEITEYLPSNSRKTYQRSFYNTWSTWARVYTTIDIPTKTDVGLGNVANVLQAAQALTLTAGDGLTGGGDLSANRTFTLGTPSTLTTATANAVTATSHTHAVTFPVTSVANKTGAVSLTGSDVGLGNVSNVLQAASTLVLTAGNGLTGGGNLTANRTFTLGTPSTLTTATANAVTATSHTHAVTFPVTSVASKTGAVSLSSSDVGLGNVSNDAQLKMASNLSDLNNVATARTNLGIANHEKITVNSAGEAVISTSGGGTALRVTQSGTGNALVVEDSASTDSSPLVVDSGGNLIVGATTSEGKKFRVVGHAAIEGDLAVNLPGDYWSSGAGIYLAGSGEAGLFGTNGSYRTSWLCNGYRNNSNQWTSINLNGKTGAAAIEMDPTGQILFHTDTTKLSGSSILPTRRMMIDGEGRVGIGDSSLSSSRLRISGITSASSGYSLTLQNSATFDPSVATTGAFQYHSSPSVLTGTLPDLRHYNAQQSTFTGSVTLQKGFEAANNLTGATNNYGFYGNIPAGTGRWNFYANGTAPNYFAGNVGLKTASPAVTLDINSTDAIRVPLGTTAQRPTGATGYLRFNTESKKFEGYNGTAWGAIGADDASTINFQQAGTGAVVRTAQDKLREGVSVKDFGAVGNGVADDTTAIQAAIDTGKVVKLVSGQKYKITSPLTGSHKIHLISDAGAEIYQDGQNFRMLDVSGVFVKSTTLSAAKEIGTRYWVVADAAGVTPGMLMEVVSSASWYYDPRPASTDARKSEMHRVRRVNGNTIETDVEANDGYPLSETVTVSFYTPVSVYLENIVFRAKHESNKATRGIYIKYADKALLQNVSVFDTSLTGVAFVGCYDSHHFGGEISGVNGDGAAYGGKFTGSTLCSFENVKFSGNYAAVDISGDNVISLMCAVVNCPVTGGGVNNAGSLMGWGEYGSLGTFQRGHGSHGPSDRCVFRNNRIEGVHVAMPIRGRNHIVEDNYFESRSRNGVIQLYFGYNCTIKNNIVDRSFFSGKDTTTYEGANVNGRLADSFIYVYGTYVTDVDGPLTVVGNKINVQDCVIDLRDTVASDFQLVYSDNSVFFKPASTSTPVSVVSAVNPAILGSRTYINASRFSAFSSSTPVTLLSSNVTLRNGAEIHNYSLLVSPTYTGGVGWTSPVPGTAMVTFSGRFASVALSITGGTITAGAGSEFSARFTLPYMDTQSTSAGHFVGVCNSTTSSGVVNFNTTRSDIQCTLTSQASNSTTVRAQFTYRIGGA